MAEPLPYPNYGLTKLKLDPPKRLMDEAYHQEAGDITFYVRGKNEEFLEVSIRDLKALLALVS